jgi:hypothetical protein
MDEIICSKCGKANLLSDNKCRYCQSPFEKSESESEPATEPFEEPEIPEWLKRIRELKILDEEREKEKEKWRQQTLFGQNNDNQKQKNKMGVKKSESIEQVENIPADPTKSSMNPQKINAPAVKPLSRTENEVEKKEASRKEGLPEGFQPLSIDEDNP